MKLTTKITGLVVNLLASVTAIETCTGVRRTSQQIAFERRRREEQLAHALVAVVQSVWRTGGWQSALSALDKAGRKLGEPTVRWTWLNPGTRLEYLPVVSPAQVEQALRGSGRAAFDHPLQKGYVVTYWPVVLPRLPLGARALTRSMRELRAREQEERWLSVRRGASLVLVAGLLAGMFGRRFLARPVRALLSNLRARAQDTLTYHPARVTSDELGDVARAVEALSRLKGMSDLPGVVREHPARDRGMLPPTVLVAREAAVIDSKTTSLHPPPREAVEAHP